MTDSADELRERVAALERLVMSLAEKLVAVSEVLANIVNKRGDDRE